MNENEPTTADLADAARSGHEKAWAAIVDRHNRAVWEHIAAFDLDERRSVYAARMTWLRALEALMTTVEPEDFEAELFRIAEREIDRFD